MGNKKNRSAGPGIGKYEDLINVLPKDYKSLLDPKKHKLVNYTAEKIYRRRIMQGA